MSDATTPEPAPEEVEVTDNSSGASTPAPEEAPAVETEPPTVEDLVNDLERVTAQRDEYLAMAQSKQAEFENFRKRVMKQQAEDVTRAASRLVTELLPVLDAFDYGVAHGHEDLAPMRSQLLGVLEKEGLARLDPAGEAFDPNEHEAVAHEEGEGEGPVVAETLRAGFRWNGHLLRPAMVRVKG